MNRPRESGMVLVACLLLLVLLSLLGASSLLSSSINAQLVGNLARRGEAYYAAEAAAEVGVARVLKAFRTTLKPYVPDAQWHDPDIAVGDPCSGTYNGYHISFRISNAIDPARPATAPTAMPYSTFENGQMLSHYSYLYKVEAQATGPVGGQTITETIRLLETPLVQYFVFYDDDLSFNPATMTCWGRVHTNGNLYFLNGPTRFRNYDLNNAQTPNQITVHGQLYSGQALCEGGRGVTVSGSTDTAIRVTNWGTVPAPTSDFVALDTTITSSNQGTQEARYKDGDNYYVKIGVPSLPSVQLTSLTPGAGHYYYDEAGNPSRPGVDGMRILSSGSALTITLTLNGGALVDVTNLVRDYKVSGTTSIDLNRWTPEAKTRADTTTANTISTGNNNPIIPGTIVYSPESVVPTDEANAPTNMTTKYTSARTANTNNPRYPCVLEHQDPRETAEVDLTVIDLQRLELWYRDYLDYQDDHLVNGSNTMNQWAPDKRTLLIYISRTAATKTLSGALPAVKLIGSRAGRTRGPSTNATPSVPTIPFQNFRQQSPTLVTNTTIATDNPIYLDGDFNAPGAQTGNYEPGDRGCAILSDAVTLLSNNWGNFSYLSLNVTGTYGQTSGTYTKPLAMEPTKAGPTTTTPTTFNAAFVTGRYNFTGPNTRSGNRGALEAQVNNFLRFIEDWDNNGVYESTNNYNPYGTVNSTGSLINLWFSSQADSDFVCCGTTATDIYDLPSRKYGWDSGFANMDYWPPYIPSIYSVERVSWQLQ